MPTFAAASQLLLCRLCLPPDQCTAKLPNMKRDTTSQGDDDGGDDGDSDDGDSDDGDSDDGDGADHDGSDYDDGGVALH